jgi:SEC-C motif-containing protein
MRSRYCAFALGEYGDYLFRTWHPAGRGNLSPTDLAEKNLNWNGLEIVDSAQSGDSGTVEFVAHFEDHNGQHGIHHEISRFVREAGQWLYFDGTIISA